MPGKRRRDGSAVPEPSQGPVNGNSKPISAVAAAKLKLRPVENIEQLNDDLLISQTSPTDAVASDYGEIELEDELPDVQQNVQLCTWRYGQDHVSSESEEQLTVFLDKNSTIALIGCFDFVVLKGAVNLNGANFAASIRSRPVSYPQRAYVPSTNPISSIRGLDSKNEIRFLDCNIPVPLEHLSPLYTDIWNVGSTGSWRRSFALVTESDADPIGRPLVPEVAPDDWVRQIEDCATGSTTTIITGQSSSGKSIFSRRLLNRYLTGLGKSAPALSEVYYLDLDSSKPEYSPHGQISLTLVRETNLGPAFTHPATIPKTSGKNETIRAHPLPIINLADHEDYYLACVENLVQAYTASQSRHRAPLIINTPGWAYSIDFRILLEIISRTRPQCLVHLGDTEPADEINAAKMDALEAQCRKEKASVNLVSAHVSVNKPSHTDTQLRSMQMLSYFHANGLTAEERPQRSYITTPISHTIPWEFCYEETSQSTQSFIGCLMLNDWVEPNQLLPTLSGSLVQIISTQDEDLCQLFDKLPRTKTSGIPYFEKGPRGKVEPMNPSFSQLICTALLRSWDPENKVAHILVPKTHEAMLHTLQPTSTVLVFGCCEHPEWALTEDSYDSLSHQRQSVYRSSMDQISKTSLEPWVAPASLIADMGYMSTTRRVRKFQQ